MTYADPNATVRREYFAGEAGGGATTEYGKFRSFQKARLKKVHAVVTVAGTATTHKLDVYHGTTSISSISLSTAAAGGTAAARRRAARGTAAATAAARTADDANFAAGGSSTALARTIAAAAAAAAAR